MPEVHRDGDGRVCGASTVVVRQSTVYANGKLWAVQGDPNSHGGGALSASGSGVFVESTPVIVHAPDSAAPDALCIPIGGLHCAPATASGSPDVFAYDT
jgi:hypothetical protein